MIQIKMSIYETTLLLFEVSGYNHFKILLLYGLVANFIEIHNTNDNFA